MGTPLPIVKPQQIWADNDPREKGRTLRVVSVGVNSARCEVVTVAAGSSDRAIGKTRMIALARFRPTSNGYTLVNEAVDG